MSQLPDCGKAEEKDNEIMQRANLEEGNRWVLLFLDLHCECAILTNVT